MRIRNLALASTALALVFVLEAQSALAAPALPTGGTTVAGSATISAPSSSRLTITQGSNRAVIDWTSFSVGQGGVVTFRQPGADAATLNRVTSDTTSLIAGEITANGSVFLINPNGIEITKSGIVDVGQGFIASTLDISDRDFLAGKGMFSTAGAGLVANAGTITTGAGGYVGLLGGAVSDSGIIAAPAGQVFIGAGRAATLDINGGSFLQVTLPTSAALTRDGATAVLSAAAARAAVRGAVNLPGAVDAQSVSGQDGDVTLSGSITASGGSITVSAPGLIALKGATLDTSSAEGGGAIKIGGKGDAVQASALSVDASSVLSANGGATGSGGGVSLWSTGQTDFAGAISAQGGAFSGDGGSAEVSGHVVSYAGTTNLLAANGTIGDLLIDPYNVTISTGKGTGAGFTAKANNTVINNVTLETALKTASVTISTGSGGSQAGAITVDAPIAWTSGSTLALSAFGSIAVDSTIKNTGAGSLILRADNTGVGKGTVSFGSGDKVNFSGSKGTVSIYYDPTDNPAKSAINKTSYTKPTNYAADVTTKAGVSGQLTAYMLVNTVNDLQNVENNLTGDYALGRNIDASATKNWNPATVNGLTVHGGFVPIEFDGASAFTGILAGQGYTISGLYENWGTSSLGLFGYVGKTGVIRGVNLTDVSFNFGQGAIYGGVLVGHNLGLISGDSASGTVNSAIEGATGGLVAYNESSGVIVGSHSSVKVTYVGSQNDEDTDYGGLVGNNYGLVETSYATGAVTDEAQTSNVGGLIGFNNGSEGVGIVENSYATGKVTGGTSQLGGGSSVGGLVGYDLGAASTKDVISQATAATGPTLVPGEIYLSYATGEVVDTGAHAFVGGLVGEVDENGGLLGDHATGAVVGGSDGAYGGLAGVSTNGAGIIDSYASGNVSTGIGDEVGGLVGLNAGDGGIVADWAFGNVTAGAADAANAYASKAGGLVGYNQTLISGAYALGNVTVGATTSKSEGAIAYAGGLVGNDLGGTLNQVYAVGRVKGGAGSLIGGLSGGPGAGVTAGYWDTQTSGLSKSAEGVGETTAQLQAALPPGFGSDSWGIIAGKSFPYLLVQFVSLATGKSEGTPQVVSGTISGFANDGGRDVSLRINGKVVAPAAEMPSTAGGYYYVLLAPGTIAAAGGNKVLVDVAGGATFDDVANGSITGLNINAKTLDVISNAAKYSTLETQIDQDLGVATSIDGVARLESEFTTSKLVLDDTDTAGFTLDRAISDGAETVVIDASGNLSLDAALTGKVVDLVTDGTLTQTSTGIIRATTLEGHSARATNLNAANLIGALGPFTTADAGFSLVDHKALTVSGKLSTGSGWIFLTTAGAGSNLTIGDVSTTGTLTLVSSGEVKETSTGAIVADTLNVTADTGILLTAKGNQITKVGVDSTKTGPNQINR